MRMADLIGHEQPVALLQRSLIGGRVSNAYLFVGEQGIGKAAAAAAFARALVCETPDVDAERDVYEACGRCSACGLAAAGNHPHLRTIAPDGEHIKIDQMRELRHDVALTAFGGARRAYVLMDAEAMTEESANCILKTLEEPPAGVTLILVTPSPSNLLPTIISRCQMVRFRPAPVPAVEQLLVECYAVPGHHARFIAGFSGGRVGWAIQAAQHPGLLGVRGRRLHQLEGLPDAPPGLGLRAAEEVRLLARELATEGGSDSETAGAAPEPTGASAIDRQVRAHADTLLDMARSWFRDLLVLKRAEDLPLVNADRRGEMATVADHYTVGRIEEALDAISRTRHYLARNANVSLALEVMMSRLVVTEQ